MNIIDAARYFVFLSYKDIGSLTPLKLQKILYLAQGWSYVWDNKPLFGNNHSSIFDAWQYGPVNQEVYQHFKKYGSDEIPALEGIPSICEKDSRETLEAIWNKYSQYSASSLVTLTHSQDPWQKAYQGNGVITNLSIKTYFQSTYLS